MPSDSSRRTLRGQIQGHVFVVEVTANEDDSFQFTVTVDGIPVPGRAQAQIQSKGDAFQLGIAAAERYVTNVLGKG